MSDVRRRRYAKRMQPSERRDQVLDTTLALVVEGGHFTVTIQAIANEMGVTKPVVYDYFANREEILAALLERELAIAGQALAAFLSAPLPKNLAEPDDLLRERLAGWLQLIQEKPSTWKFILLPPAGMPLEPLEVVHEGRERTRLVIESILSWWIAQSGARRLDATELEIASHLVQVVTRRAAELVLSDPARYPADEVARTAIDLLVPRRPPAR